MARQTVTTFVSDISGKPIDEAKAVLITITYADGRRNKVELDAGEDEVAEWASKGRVVKLRGRAPGSRNKSATANPDPKPSGNGRRRRKTG